MALEALLFTILLGTALLLILRRLRRPRPTGLGTVLLAFGLAGSLAIVLMVAQQAPRQALVITDRPIEVHGEGYVSSSTCKSCHPNQYQSWFASYHRTMTQIATPEAVMGPFDTELEVFGRTYRLERVGDEFWVDMVDPDLRVADGPRVRRRIVMTTGSHHRQYVWFETGKSRKLRRLPFIYLGNVKRWAPSEAVRLAPPVKHPAQQWITPEGEWNEGCVECHAVRGRTRSDQGGKIMDTHVSELGIACESCHGPAAQHVAANHLPQRRYEQHFDREPDPTIVHPKRLSHKLSSQVCGQCHGIFIDHVNLDEYNLHGDPYRPGQDLDQLGFFLRASTSPENSESMRKTYKELNLSRDYFRQKFWPDGTIAVKGREYTALLDTPCFQNGDLSCLSCHTMHKDESDPRSLENWANHQLKPNMDGNEACLQCHADMRDAISEHTFHEAGSSGSQCYNCHMPRVTYGLQESLVSHRVDSPTVPSTARATRPNACNLCHLDKTVAWTADRLSEWYGASQPELSEEERSVAASVVWLLSGDARQRATVAWHLGWEPAQQASGTQWMPPFLAQLLGDPYAAVRFAAHQSLRAISGFEDLQYDFVKSADQQAEALGWVTRRWQQRSAASGASTDMHALVVKDPAAQLAPGVLGRLLARRDDRPMSIAE